jgi:hypothetical protein
MASPANCGKLSLMTTTDITPMYRGEVFEEHAVGEMNDCSPLLGDMVAMRRHLAEKGYVFLRGFHERQAIVEGRRVIIDRLQQAGALDDRFDPMEGVLKEGGRAPGFAGGILKGMFPQGWEHLHNVLYTGKLMKFFADFYAEPVAHYDFTWMRLVNPGPATLMHADVVYMGRGTHDLHTVWTPWGDNGYDTGGLVVLEGSNNRRDVLQSYWNSDVDAFCANKEDKTDGWKKTGGGWVEGTAKQLHQMIGGRWLTADYQMGDIVIFHVHTIHGGTDNQSSKVRISTDTRYQKKSDAIDDRWIGEQPPAHGPTAKRGMIC